MQRQSGRVSKTMGDKSDVCLNPTSVGRKTSYKQRDWTEKSYISDRLLKVNDVKFEVVILKQEKKKWRYTKTPEYSNIIQFKDELNQGQPDQMNTRIFILFYNFTDR